MKNHICKLRNDITHLHRLSLTVALVCASYSLSVWVLVGSQVPALDFTQKFQREPCKSGGIALYQVIYVQIQLSTILVHYLNIR